MTWHTAKLVPYQHWYQKRLSGFSTGLYSVAVKTDSPPVCAPVEILTRAVLCSEVLLCNVTVVIPLSPSQSEENRSESHRPPSAESWWPHPSPEDCCYTEVLIQAYEKPPARLTRCSIIPVCETQTSAFNGHQHKPHITGCYKILLSLEKTLTGWKKN